MEPVLVLYRTVFRAFERLGIHVTPRHYAFPIPDLSSLNGSTWERASDPVGLDLRESDQLALLARLTERYADEFAGLGAVGGAAAFRRRNRHFETVDAEILYGMIRDRRPGRFVEAGSGFSTMLALEAAAANARDGHRCDVAVYDPFPGAMVRERHGAGLVLHPIPVQEAPLEIFSSMAAGDILFIDSSHILQVGSDVRFLFGEVLPRLAPGVLVHVHDIFLPDDYPRYWVTEKLRFWNEQYVLQAFLCFNPAFRVVWGSNFMARRHPDELRGVFPGFQADDLPASFWFERVAVEPRG